MKAKEFMNPYYKSKDINKEPSSLEQALTWINKTKINVRHITEVIVSDTFTKITIYYKD